MSKPIVLVFAGANGSGKSTFSRLMPLSGTYIYADDLKRENNLSDLEAAEKAEALRKRLVEKKRTLLLRQFYQQTEIFSC